MLSCTNLTLRIEDNIIAKTVGFTLFPGAIISVIGANGEGKTTLLKTLASLHSNDNSITHNGICINDSIYSYKSNISYIGHDSFLLEELTVLENLEFWGKINGRELSIFPVSKVFNITAILRKKIKNLSTGTKKKVLLSSLLLRNSQIWLLDEPFVNLDSEGMSTLLSIFESKSQQGGIIILSSHISSHIEKYPILNLKDFKYD